MSTRPGKSESITASDSEAWKRLTGSLPVPSLSQDRDDLLWQQLVAQFGWYQRAATRTRLA